MTNWLISITAVLLPKPISSHSRCQYTLCIDRFLHRLIRSFGGSRCSILLNSRFPHSDDTARKRRNPNLKQRLCVCVYFGFFLFFLGFFCWHIIHGNIIKWGKNWHNLTLVSATCARLQKSRGAQVTEALQIWCDIKLSTRGKHKNNKLCYLSHIFVWECLSLFCFFANKIFDTNYYKQINKCNNS